MKKLTLLIALLSMAVLPLMAEHVTPETARKAATAFFNNNGMKSAQLSDISKAAGFSNLYIFNGNQGFVIIAADDCVQPILGYSLTGRFVTENMPVNARAWLEGYNQEIQYAIDNQMRATAETAQLWKDLVSGQPNTAKATIIVDALVKTQWDQNPVYNDLCPYDSNTGELTVTGCVATAMAQIMRYWEYPSHGVGSHSYTPSTHSEYGSQSVNFAQATYDWTNMPLYSANSEIAKLMYHCGVSVNMDYDVSANGGSGAYSSNIPNALINYFNYYSTANYEMKATYSENNWLSLIKEELDNSRPVQYSGSGSGGGHAFVCDGYDNSNYFHFNWGWSGANDGFYSLSDLTPGSGGAGGGSYSFTNNQAAVIGIQPKASTASTPADFNVTKSDKNAILTWSEATNAVEYYIYRNGMLIGSTTSTTYTDENLSYGSYDYYVKSRDANGSSPDPTQTITVVFEPVASNLSLAESGNGAVLSWTEPEWTTPATDNEILTYGDGTLAFSFGAGGGYNFYFGHRYPASMIDANKALYKVSFYATETGAFTLCVYTADSGNSKPQTQIYTQSHTVSAPGWNDIILSTPVQLDNTKDLWVFIYDPEGKGYPMGIGEYSGSDGNYISTSNPTSYVSAQPDGYANLIKTFITDGSFNYNLYDNGTLIAQNLSGTSYSISELTTNIAHQYTLKTVYQSAETEASNMAGITKGEASLSSMNLDANDKMVVTEGSALTVEGTLTDLDPTNLILENGAQLINQSEGVKAIVKKTIAPYSNDQNNGWNLIASPFAESITPSADNGLLTNNYDLYSFDQSEDLEWRNIKASAFSTIDNKTGYLYANSGNTNLELTGTLVANTTATELIYNADATLQGFNLIGNPYPCNTYIDRSFYVLQEGQEGSEFVLGSNPIPPYTAIMVQAQGADESVSFSKTASKNAPGLTVSIAKAGTIDNTIIDNARICFDQSQRLAKYALRKDNSKLYIPQNGKNYAVAYAAEQDEMPLNFEVTRNGTYTITIEASDLELDYLFLADNLTGDNVNLLTTPSYTFDASINDYSSRFKLIFAPAYDESGLSNDNDFGFVLNDQFQMYHAQGTLQIIDMNGRILLTANQTTSINLTGLDAGIYMVRLITENKVLTQKIII